MAILRGEIDLDGKKAIVTLRQVQSETSQTSKSFDRASYSTKKLASSFLTASSGGSALNKAMLLLGKTGLTGFGFASAYRVATQFAEALNKTGLEAEKSGKTIESAFKAGRSADNVEEISRSIQALRDEQKSLEEQAGKFDLQRMFAKGLKKLTGVDIGADILETNAQSAQLAINNLEKLLKIREEEQKKLSQNEKLIKRLSAEEKSAGLTKRKMILGGVSARVAEINEAENLLAIEKTRLKVLEDNLKILSETNKEARNEKLIAETTAKLEEQKLKFRDAQLSVTEKQAAKTKETMAQGIGVTPPILGASRGGRQALEVATKQRAEKVRKEDFKTQEALLRSQAEALSKKEGRTVSVQEVRKKIAAGQAAAAQPTLAEQFAGQASGIAPSLIAAQRAGGLEKMTSLAEEGQKLGFGISPAQAEGGQGFGAGKQQGVGNFGEVVKALQELIKKFSEAPLLTK